MLITKLSSPKIILILICIFFLFTRFLKINEIPPALYWDEASIGYNAYSIAQTGRDEWGEFLPLHFRAFGEFKLPVYIYAVVPLVKLFGLNSFSVRLPAILFSLGVVFLTYLLAKKLRGNETAGLLSSFFVSLSPWFFIFSRTGYEVTAGLMFYLLGIFLFFNKLSGKVFLFSIASLILSAYSYNSFRIISPLTLLLLLIFKKEEIFRIIKTNFIYIAIAVFLLIVSFVPVFRLYLYDTGGARLQAVGATSATFVKNYFSHFSPFFLFLDGDKNLRSQQSGFGQLFLPEFLLLPLGIFYLIRSRTKYSFLILILMILGPIPAAITKESPHALRSVSMVPFLAIICATGVDYLKSLLKKRYVVYLSIVIFLGFFINYFFNFLNIYPTQSSKDWQYGYKRIYTDYRNQFNQYDYILISDEYAEPYIFALFYLKINPDRFRQEVIRNSIDQWGFSLVSSFDKLIFSKVRMDNLPKGKSLIFASATEKFVNLVPKGIIYNLDSSIAFYVYEFTQ